MKRQTRQHWLAFGYLTPALTAIVLVTLIPAVYNFFIAFTNFGLFHYQSYEWVGLANFQEILSLDSPLLPVMGWTLAWTFLSSFVNVGLGFLVALMLTHPGLRERNLYRTLLIIPWALPGVLSIQMWHSILGADGFFNRMLQALGATTIPWLTHPGWARLSVIMVNAWLSFPYFMVVSIAAIQNIPSEVKEAAMMDGASSWQRFRWITLPMTRVLMLPLWITQVAFQFNNFNLIYLLTGGGPRLSMGDYFGATDIMVSYTFNLMREAQRYGLTSAFGVLTFLLTVGILLLSTSFTRAMKEGI